jgi:hypothetical protein
MPAVSCLHCQGQFVFNPNLVGKRIRCPHCKTVIVMPSESDLSKPIPIAVQLTTPIHQQCSEPAAQSPSGPLDFLESAATSMPTHEPSTTYCRPKAKKTGVPVAVWIGGGVVVCFMLLMCAGIASHSDTTTSNSGTISSVEKVASTPSGNKDVRDVSHSSVAYRNAYRQGKELANAMSEAMHNYIQSVGSNWNEATSRGLTQMMQHVKATYRDFRRNYLQASQVLGDDNENVQSAKGALDGFVDELVKEHVVSRVEQLDEN